MQMSHLAVSGALSHTADITIDVATSKTLTYSGAAISLGANTLTLSLAEEVLLAEDLHLTMLDSKLLLNSITVDNVSTTSDSLGLDVDVQIQQLRLFRLPTLRRYQ